MELGCNSFKTAIEELYNVGCLVLHFLDRGGNLAMITLQSGLLYVRVVTMTTMVTVELSWSCC